MASAAHSLLMTADDGRPVSAATREELAIVASAFRQLNLGLATTNRTPE
jgi:hypothetical protein